MPARTSGESTPAPTPPSGDGAAAATAQRAPSTRSPKDQGVVLHRLRALDGIRGVALTFVVIYHMMQFLGYRIRKGVNPATDQLPRRHGLPEFFYHVGGSELSVHIFFVLSGALITSLLLTEFDVTRKISLRSFYERRIRRLAPALLLALFAVSFFALGGARIPPLGDHPLRAFFAILTSTGNWIALSHPLALGWLAPTWSLAIEEQFYITWPLILLLMLRARLRTQVILVSLVLATILCQAYIAIAAAHEPARNVHHQTPVGFLGLLIGCALGVMLTRYPFSRFIDLLRLQLVGFVALVALIVAAITIGPHWGKDLNGGFLICDLLTALVIGHIFARGTKHSVVTALFSFRPFVWLGVISYGVYLIHFPVIVGMFTFNPRRSPMQQVWIDVILTLVLATASYWLIERPIRRGGRKRAKHVDVAASAETEHEEPAPAPLQRQT
jgi:peptidoglycan/LPS O-acetylase OafA/YrhL